MRQDIRQELRKYQMEKIKPNFTELGRQLGCDPRTAKKYYYLKEDGYENKRKRRKSKLDPYRNIIDEKVKNSCSATSIFYFIKEMGYCILQVKSAEKCNDFLHSLAAHFLFYLVGGL